MLKTKNVGSDIKAYLEKNSIPQNKLADKINLSRTTLNEILKGKRKLSIEVAFKLEEFFIGKAKTWLQKQLDYEIIAFKKQVKTNKLPLFKNKLPEEK